MMRKTILSLFLPLIAFQSQAQHYKVSSLSELQSAMNNARKGDTIVLASGKYKNGGIISFTNDDITVMAERNGSVTLTGNTAFKITASHSTLSGMQFIDGEVDGNKGKVVEVLGNYNQITQCNFSNVTSHNYIHIEADAHDNVISYCNLEKKPAVHNAGPGIQINTSEATVSHTLITHCTFLNFDGDGGDFGNEPIRIGLGKEQNNISGTIVEYCYFENLGMADSETISVKSTSNVIRYNTFQDNPKGQLVFRTGNRNTAYGNYFIRSGGIRIKEGQHHMIYNNYFEGESDSLFPALRLMNFKLNQKSNVGLPLDDIKIAHNTFYETNPLELGAAGSNPPTHVIFSNNIFVKSKGTLFNDFNTENTFQNNLFWGDAGTGREYKEKEMTKKNPLLQLNENKIYALTAQSPAINQADDKTSSMLDNEELKDDDFMILLDIEGQKREQKKDIGCDEFSKESKTNIPLTKKNTGPSYLNN